MASLRYATLTALLSISLCGFAASGGSNTPPRPAFASNASGGSELPPRPPFLEDDYAGPDGDASEPGVPPKPPFVDGTDDSEEPQNPGPDSGNDQGGNDEPDDSDEDIPTPDDDVSGGLPPSNGAMPRIRIVNQGASSADASVTTGQVFARGAVASGSTVAASIGGQRIPAQVDKKASWPDGSLRHAVVTLRLSQNQADGNPVVELNTIKKGTSGAPVSIGQVLATSFDANVSLSVGGTRYSASARNLLSQADQRGNCDAWARECKHWLSGPLTSEWIIGGPISANGEAHPHLSVYFHVRAYADASGRVSRVRVDSVIENDWAYAPNPGNQRYNARITVGDKTFDAPDLTHYRQARWHKVMWWNGAPKVYAQLDTEYLQSTGAVSNYADLNMSNRFLNSRATGYPPLTDGEQTAHMGNSGAQAGIGPLPRWTTTYVISGAPRALKWMLANDDAVGSFSFHYRDSTTGRPLRITDHPYVTLANIRSARRASKYNSSAGRNYKADLLPACSRDCGSPYEFNIAHHPSIGYVPYLVTGNYYYLEEMQFTASYIQLWANPDYRNYGKGRLRNAQSQIRSQAWSLRSIADAAFATPDNDPMKPYFEDQIATIVSDYARHYADNTAKHPLHFVDDTHDSVRYPSGGQDRVATAPWQVHFFAWAAGHVAEQGFDKAERLRKWLSPFQINMMTGALNKPKTGYCWLAASTYKLRVRDTRRSPLYTTLDEAYKNSLKKLYGLECNSQEYANRLGASRGKNYQRGEMSGYAHSPTGFPSNLQIGLSMAADSGLKNAKKAWQVFDTRSVKPDYSEDPNFAVVPRF